MKRLLSLFMAMPLSVVVSAGSPNTWPGKMLACRDIVPDAARLICFDRLAATVAPARVSPAPRTSVPRTSAPQSSVPQSAAPAVAAAPAVKDALDPQRTFGLSHATIVAREASAAGVPVKELSHITARVVRILQAPDQGAIFDLDNGEVWKQLDPDGTYVDTRAGDTVEISRGSLGSYWLQMPSHRRCNVTRLR